MKRKRKQIKLTKEQEDYNHDIQQDYLKDEQDKNKETLKQRGTLETRPDVLEME
jgi:hypothetical protein